MSIYRATLALRGPFDLRATLISGAAFGWGRYNRRGRMLAYGEPDRDGWFSAPTYGTVVRFRQIRPDRLEIESLMDAVESPGLPHPLPLKEFARWYFRMDEKLPGIIRRISRDARVAEAAELLPGLRLLRVDPPECLLTFLFSPQNRVPNIARILNRVCRTYGERVVTPWGAFYLVPDLSRLAGARASKLASCGLRYGVPQAKNLIRTCRRIADQPDFFSACTAPVPYPASHRRVLDVCVGAGPKVADCVCLLGLGHLEAVPVDVHVFNTTIRLYRRDLRGIRATDADHLTARDYRRIGDFYRARFGGLAGYAQQYLFTAERIRRGFLKLPNTSPNLSRSPTP